MSSKTWPREPRWRDEAASLRDMPVIFRFGSFEPVAHFELLGDMYDRPFLRQAVAEHCASTSDHAGPLWSALNLSTWRETFRC